MDIKVTNATKFNIALVGCGGTGSQLLPFLMQLCDNVSDKIGQIVLIDGDKFESKNTRNQKCLEEEVGENKAEALSERWSYIYEDLNITYYADFVRSLKDLRRAVPKGKVADRYDSSITIVIGAVDRNSTRKLLHEFFHYLKDNGNSAIYIDSGNGDVNRIGQIITGYVENKEIKSRPVADYFPEILDSEEDLLNLNHCTLIASDHPQNIATNVMAASILFSVITNIIMFGKIEKGVIYFDADKHSVVSR